MSYKKMKEEKALARKRDRLRLARGEVTPAQLQRENAFLSEEFCKKAKILNFRQVARAMAA